MSLDELSRAIEEHGRRRCTAQEDSIGSSGAIAPWAVSGAVHLGILIAGAVMISSRLTDQSASVEYAAGDLVVPNVRLLSEEEYRNLFTHSAPIRETAQPEVSPLKSAESVEQDQRKSPAPVEKTVPPPPVVGQAPDEPDELAESDPVGPAKSLTQVSAIGAIAPQLNTTQSNQVQAGSKTPPGSTTIQEPADGASAVAVPRSPQESSVAGNLGVPSAASVENRPVPRYPRMSIRNGEHGLVLLRIEVGADGSVGRIEVLEDPGHRRLVEAAIEAAREARFRPATRDGKPIDSYVEVRYRFVLERG